MNVTYYDRSAQMIVTIKAHGVSVKPDLANMTIDVLIYAYDMPDFFIPLEDFIACILIK
jgi:hypothetical protein